MASGGSERTLELDPTFAFYSRHSFARTVAGDRPISYIKVFVYVILPALIIILLLLWTQQS